MNDPVNLNRFRKARKKLADQKQAAENRVRFGRTKAERQMEEDRSARLERQLAQHRRESPPEQG